MDAAFKAWELENSIKLINPRRDALYKFSPATQAAFNERKSWASSPSYFRHVRISAVALLKMVMHAHSGSPLEVMGLMQGMVRGNTFIVTDAFRLPVTGTETRVNAQDEANEYIPTYLQYARDLGRLENIVGWYHSHPGYGCWLSGIDVGTQKNQQQWQDPSIAVVIDPDRTISTGKVDIGAFRTYPNDYKPLEFGEDDEDGFESVPLNKTEEFGAHALSYYPLDITYFRSALDTHLLSQLWKKYWVSTLLQNPFITNREFAFTQITDLTSKIRKAGRMSKLKKDVVGRKKRSEPSLLEKIAQDGQKVAIEEELSLIAVQVRKNLFGNVVVKGKN